MGNSVGGRKKVKIMKIDGEIFKLKIPTTAMDVLKDYPASYVLLESESVKKIGIRAPKLRPEEELQPGKLYFLVEMPKFPEERLSASRRVRSGAVHMTSAQERLQSLMMSRERPDFDVSGMGSGSGPVRVKLRLPRAQIEILMKESKDEVEVAEKILELCFKMCSAEEETKVLG